MAKIWYQPNSFKPPVAKPAVRSKAMVLLLLIYCLLLLLLYCEFCVLSLICYSVFCVLFSFAIILMGKRELVALL